MIYCQQVTTKKQILDWVDYKRWDENQCQKIQFPQFSKMMTGSKCHARIYIHRRINFLKVFHSIFLKFLFCKLPTSHKRRKNVTTIRDPQQEVINVFATFVLDFMISLMLFYCWYIFKENPDVMLVYPKYNSIHPKNQE